jgi:hypothetical protein
VLRGVSAEMVSRVVAQRAYRRLFARRLLTDPDAEGAQIVCSALIYAADPVTLIWPHFLL